MVEEIVEFLTRCRWSPEEIAYVRPDLPRWERYLRRMGIAVILHCQSNRRPHCYLEALSTDTA
jgi:hypothetical protein